jgi:NTP pyrophosphatase (non-canonical NTP hydrolase)
MTSLFNLEKVGVPREMLDASYLAIEKINQSMATWIDFSTMVWKKKGEDHDGYLDEVMHALLGLSSECGEVVQLFKKDVYGNVEMSRDKLLLELGDLFYYMMTLARLNGLTPGDIAIANIHKLAGRNPSTHEFVKEKFAINSFMYGGVTIDKDRIE